jgi:hypothetical protein
MDWATSNHRPHPRREPPAPVRIEVRWRVLMGPSGRVLSCGLYEHPRGVEARCGYRDDDDLLHSRVELTIGAARTRADAWLEAVKAKGSCEVLRASGADVCTPTTRP